MKIIIVKNNYYSMKAMAFPICKKTFIYQTKNHLNLWSQIIPNARAYDSTSCLNCTYGIVIFKYELLFLEILTTFSALVINRQLQTVA
jgi:hypothetical protein